MKFFIDESVEKPIVDWLRDQKYDVMYVVESSSGITDEEVIKLANNEKLTCLCYYSCGNYTFKNSKKKTVKNERYFKKYFVIPFG